MFQAVFGIGIIVVASGVSAGAITRVSPGSSVPTRTMDNVAVSAITGVCPGQTETVANAECCVLFPLLSDLHNLFTTDTSALCSQSARGILHVAFHDAMGFSLNSATPLGGGADGSILTFSDQELSYPVNAGLADSVAALKPLGIVHGLSDGDVLHFAAAAALASCEGGPRVPFFLGRPSAVSPALASSPGPLQPTDSVTTILARFQDIGFSPEEVITLMAAHSIGASYTLDAASVQSPFDSTPNLFDNQFYIETLLPGKFGNTSNAGEVLSQQGGVMRLQSDFALARDSRTECTWQGFMNDQTSINPKFSAAMAKLQVLGQNLATMIDCSDVIPTPPSLPSNAQPHIPAGYNVNDLDISLDCPLPSTKIITDSGTMTTVSPVQCEGYGNGCWHHQGQTISSPQPTMCVVAVESDLEILETELSNAEALLQSPSFQPQDIFDILQDGVFLLEENEADFLQSPAVLNLFDASAGYAQLLRIEFIALEILQQLRVFHDQFTAANQGANIKLNLQGYSRFVALSMPGMVEAAGIYSTLVSEIYDALTNALAETLTVYADD